jgi:hypothetical protein
LTAYQFRVILSQIENLTKDNNLTLAKITGVHNSTYPRMPLKQPRFRYRLNLYRNSNYYIFCFFIMTYRYLLLILK